MLRQLGWFNLPHSPTLPPPVTAKHPGQIPDDETTQGQMAVDGKTLRKGEV